MQSPSLIQDFPHLPPKRRLELQKQYSVQQQQQQQQQPPPLNDDDDNNMICDDEPPFKKPRPGVTTNLMYKLTEFAAYTFGVSSQVYNIYNTITGGPGGNDNQKQSTRQGYDYEYYDDVLQINADGDEENDLNDHEFDKKEGHAWVENEEEEPPPPYESSWYMSTPEAKPLTTPALSSSPSQESDPEQPSTPQQIFTRSITTTPPSRRRQFRVRRGRRLLRRKSSSVDMSSSFNNEASTSTQPEEDDDIFLKFNCRLSDMINEANAALKSKPDVTEVDIMLAEEKEREERIMKELGIQAPAGRRARRLTGSSTSSDYEYYSSVLGSGHSNKSNTSLFDNGQNCYLSPTGYSADNGFSTNRPFIGHSSPTQYGPPGAFNSFNGYSNANGYGYLGGSPSTGGGYGGIPTTNRFNYSTAGVYGGSSSGFGSLHNFGQNSSGYGSNSGFSSRGMHNSRGYY